MHEQHKRSHFWLNGETHLHLRKIPFFDIIKQNGKRSSSLSTFPHFDLINNLLGHIYLEFGWLHVNRNISRMLVFNRHISKLVKISSFTEYDIWCILTQHQ